MDRLFSNFNLNQINKNVKYEKIKTVSSDEEKENFSDDEEIVNNITQTTKSGLNFRIINVNINLEDKDFEPGNIRNNIIRKLKKEYLFKVINNIMIIELELLGNDFNLCYDRGDNFKSVNVSIRVKEKYYSVGENIECFFKINDKILIGKTKDMICYLSYQGVTNQKTNNEYLLIDKNKSFKENDKIIVQITKILSSGYCDFFQSEGKIIDIADK